MSKIKVILLLAVTMMIAGCSRTTGLKYTPPALENNWTVKMTLSGGIAGLKRSIHVRADGSYVVIDERNGKQVTGDLAEGELSELEDLLSTLQVTASDKPSVCADCFEYEVEIETGGRKMIVKADDLTLGDSGAGSLVQFLQKRMDTALQ